MVTYLTLGTAEQLQLYLPINLEISASCISFGGIALEKKLIIIIRNELVEYIKHENRN